jgi:hypothetical protein
MSVYVCMYMYCYIQKDLTLYAIKIIIIKILIFNNACLFFITWVFLNTEIL